MSNSLFHLLQTTDSFFPSGSYAHSFGLEGLIQSGVVSDQESLAVYLYNAVLPALQHSELPYLRFAYHAALAEDFPKLAALNASYNAMKGSRELREASLKIGSQRLRMLKELKSHALWHVLPEGHAVIIAGVEALVMGIPLNEMMSAYYYQSIVSPLSASLKLLKIGHTAVQRLLKTYSGQGPAIVAASESVTEERAGWFSLLVDVASARHETAYSRLFIS